MADIDNLTIEISADANAAINALEALSNKLGSLATQLDNIDPSKLNSVSSVAKGTADAFSSLGDSAKSIEQVANNLEKTGQQVGNMAELGDAAEGAASAMEDITQTSEGASQSLEKIKNTSEDARSALDSIKGVVGGIGSALGNVPKYVNSFGTSVRNVASGLQSIGDTAKKAFNGLTAPIRSAAKSMRNLDASNNYAATSAKKLVKELTRVSKMLKLMVTRMALRAVIKEVGNGFKSLALHSEEFNNSVSSMINGSKKLGYSFAAMVSPLINALAPALNYIIGLLTKLLNIINQVFSAMSGASTYNRAKDFTEDWAKNISGANKEAKELKKTVLGFDELNQLQKESSSGGASNAITDMFETVAIDKKWDDLAKKIKNIANKLFEPIKKAWAKVGDFVKKSWKYALDEVLKLGKSVARDFWKAWEQEKTQKIFENILKTIGWIGQAVGNLAKRFREAWDKNDTGLHILENIRDIVLIITEHIESMAKATAEWADSLDFSPLLESFNEWLESCKPAVDALMGVLEDFYTTVLLPIGKWAVEEGGPKLLQVFTDFNNKVDWEGLREKLQKLWEHLEPFAETVGEGLILFVERVSNALANFLNSEEFDNFLTSIEDWMDKVTPQDVADGLEAICKAILGYVAVKAVLTTLTAIAGFLTTIAALAPVLKLSIVIGVAYAGFKLGGKLGKWLTDDPVYDEYTLPVILKWTVEEMPTSWQDFKDKAKDWAQAWHDMLTEADAFVAGVANAVDAVFNPLGHTLKLITGYTDIEASGVGGAGGNIEADEWQKTIEAAREATEQVKEYQDTKYGLGGRGDNTKYNPETDAWNSVSESVKKVNDSAKTATESTNNFKTGVETLTAKQKELNGAITPYATTLNNIKTSSDKASSSVPVLSEKQKGLADSLSKTTEKEKELSNATANTSKSLDLAKTSTNNYANVAPIFSKAQNDMAIAVDGLGKATDDYAKISSVDWDTVELDVANASGVFGDSMVEMQTAVKDSSTEVEKQTKEISKAFDKKNWTFEGVADGLRKTFEDAKNAIKGVWNGIADKLNGDFDIGGKKLHINLPKFANGGFPENGLFLANSTEMVGRFSNGKTAVANNAQIVEGISAGVYNAVTSAMANNSNSSRSGYIANTIVLDGEVIARTISKAQDNQSMRYSPQMG